MKNGAEQQTGLVCIASSYVSFVTGESVVKDIKCTNWVKTWLKYKFQQFIRHRGHSGEKQLEFPGSKFSLYYVNFIQYTKHFTLFT